MNDAEWLALAGLIQSMLDADGVLTLKEHLKVGQLATRLGPKLWEAIGRATRELDGEESVRSQAAKVRAKNRPLIRAALEELALSDGLAEQEQNLLEWLDELWASE